MDSLVRVAAVVSTGGFIISVVVYVILRSGVFDLMYPFWMLPYALAAAPTWGLAGGFFPGLAAALTAVVGVSVTRGFPGLWPYIAVGFSAGLLGSCTTGYARASGGGTRWGPRSALARAFAVGGVWALVGTFAFAATMPFQVGSFFIFALISGVPRGLFMVLVGSLTGGFVGVLWKALWEETPVPGPRPGGSSPPR